MGDNIGGGAPGNGLSLVLALEAMGRFRYLSYQFDPESIRQTASKKVGERFVLRLRGYNEKEEGQWSFEVTLLQRIDGKFSETSPRHGGQVNFDMGETIIVSTSKGGMLMLSSLRIPPFSLRQLTAFGILPENFDIIIAKGVNAPIAAYGPVCSKIIQVDTPGITRADMTTFNYIHRRQPLFPFEQKGIIA